MMMPTPDDLTDDTADDMLPSEAGAPEEPNGAQLREMARQRYAVGSNDDIEILDEIAEPIEEGISRADEGAWVLAWVYVPYPTPDAP
jgi:hypothetical protein